ncbi:PID-CTERM protein-sorting domain-containing protein [Spirosoma sp. KNUC1025]|uniref:PID-CTERM protein-sorting domain-containing protein n=1 Tax=Spirosoma sp. KNUC1025 TaxID=2894082 RepID=UPI003868C473|nr:hypothetical protein LN737_23865 [Spirosoma sp. KNUC1025]
MHTTKFTRPSLKNIHSHYLECIFNKLHARQTNKCRVLLAAATIIICSSALPTLAQTYSSQNREKSVSSHQTDSIPQINGQFPYLKRGGNTVTINQSSPVNSIKVNSKSTTSSLRRKNRLRLERSPVSSLIRRTQTPELAQQSSTGSTAFKISKKSAFRTKYLSSATARKNNSHTIGSRVKSIHNPAYQQKVKSPKSTQSLAYNKAGKTSGASRNSLDKKQGTSSPSIQRFSARQTISQPKINRPVSDIKPKPGSTMNQNSSEGGNTPEIGQQNTSDQGATPYSEPQGLAYSNYGNIAAKSSANAPLDGGVSVLLAAGAALGIKKAYKKRRAAKNKV